MTPSKDSRGVACWCGGGEGDVGPKWLRFATADTIGRRELQLSPTRNCVLAINTDRQQHKTHLPYQIYFANFASLLLSIFLLHICSYGDYQSPCLLD